MVILINSQVRVLPDKIIQQMVMKIANESHCMPNIEELPKVLLSMN